MPCICEKYVLVLPLWRNHDFLPPSQGTCVRKLFPFIQWELSTRFSNRFHPEAVEITLVKRSANRSIVLSSPPPTCNYSRHFYLL